MTIFTYSHIRISAYALLLLAASAARAQPAVDGYTEAQSQRVTPIVELVRRNRDAVVNIAATHVVEMRSGFFDFFDAPYHRQMRTNSVGSGAVIHSAGYVLTNAHVVAQATELKVIFADGSELPAVVVASLEEDDLAVLKVQPRRPLQAIRLGHSSDLMVGETVVAIGNPVGLSHTVTTGIVSALGREFEPSADVKLRDIIQTDAAINPGNSGGPLLNVLGEQVGVNTAIRADAQNVGFAVPVDRVRARLPELLGVATRGRVRLGITWGGEVEVTGKRGVTIAKVEAGTPAQRVLAAGQVVTAVGGSATPTLIDALVATLEQPTGKPFSVSVTDAQGTRELKLVIEEVPLPDGAAIVRNRFGLTLKPLDAQRAGRLGLRETAGLVVQETARGSEAAQAGIEPGDLVAQVGRYGVRDLGSLGLLLENVRPGDQVPFTIVRVKGRIVYRSVVVLTAR